MWFIDINNVFFTLMGYKMSYVEFFGTLAGFVAVVISAKAHPLSWPIGIINVVLLFFLFYQTGLYPDMSLQVFFLITNIMGWWRWKNPDVGEEDHRKELRVSYLSAKWRYLSILIIITGTLLMGTAAARLNDWLPELFVAPSAFPYADSFVTVTSILAQYWMVQKKAECWLMWVAADVVATVLYFLKDIRFLSLEYLLFCFIAAWGFVIWMRQEKAYPRSNG